MTAKPAKIIFTKTDEAPALATRSLLPIIRSFLLPADIYLEVKDISLAARILAHFPDYLEHGQRVENALEALGELVNRSEANIIKLPNISASVPQLQKAIKELQQKGYKLPDYPTQPKSDEEQFIQKRYARVLGSAVNPVLREGNSDRRVAKAVKEYAKKNPHSMGEWEASSKTQVYSMTEGDFYGNEQSVCLENDDQLTIIFQPEEGQEQVLKENISVTKGEVVDASFLSVDKLKKFYQTAIKRASEQEVLLSLHLKATMMKVSDPILFGHAVEAYYKDALEEFAADLESIGFNPRNGIGDLYSKLDRLPKEKKDSILNAIENLKKERPALAMVDSDKGISNLHVPSDVIIDASMPAAIRSSGKMWSPSGKLEDTLALIPDRSYSGVYQQTIDFCKKNGAFDVSTMGSVSNIGLMAKKAQEYGSHDKTFEISKNGKVVVQRENGEILFQHQVEGGDIWRMCTTKDISIQDWVRLAVERARDAATPAVFWLDENRAHDLNLIKRVKTYLQNHDTNGLSIEIMPPIKATEYTLDRVKAGQDTISVTGNVLRDYLTDLFPILELGTSAKMLSIVPLLSGGGLYETGAGGSAPKHVQQFLEENHLRWDSLGEFLALGVALEDIAKKYESSKASVLARALNQANKQILLTNKSPSRKVREPDNRASHFYLALYWSKALAEQKEDLELKEHFSSIANNLTENEQVIIKELIDCQGQSVDLKGYYLPDEQIACESMRPSSRLNQIIDA